METSLLVYRKVWFIDSVSMSVNRWWICVCVFIRSISLPLQWRIQGRGSPFEGLPSRVLSKSAQKRKGGEEEVKMRSQ